MADVKYLFIFITSGCDPAVHRSVMATPEGPVTTVGVSGIDEACEAARAAVTAGEADFIELCGAFGEAGCRQVIDAVAGEIPVGYVAYFPGEAERVEALFA